MPTAVEQIHARIAQLEARISDLRIAERELQALDGTSPRQTKTSAMAKAKRKPAPKVKQKTALGPRSPRAASAQMQPVQTMGAAITEVLAQHGPIQATAIAERIKAMGRDTNNRAISFSLQALKKRGLAKNTGGKWTAAKRRGPKTRSVPGASLDELAA